MDQFQYTITANKIDGMKTLKAKDKVIRDLVMELSGGKEYMYQHYLEKKPTPEIQLLYKCISKTLQTYEEDRLPQRIQDSVVTVKNYLVKEMLNNSVTYEVFTDTFQFVEHLECPRLLDLQARSLIAAYANKPMTFTMDIPLEHSHKYASLLENIDNDNSDYLSAILRLENIKLSLPNTPHTIMEQMLDKVYNNTTGVKLTDNAVSNVVQSMEDLVTVSKTMAARLGK